MKHLWRIIRFTGSLWRLYAGIAAFTIVVAALGLVRPILVGQVIDRVSRAFGQGETADLRPLLIISGLIFAADLLINILGNIQGFIGDQMAIRLKRLLSEEYYRKLLSLPQAYFDNELTGTVVNRLTRTIDSITRFMQMMSNNFISMFLTIFFAIIYISWYAWPVALLIIVLIPLYFLLTRSTSNRWQELEKKINGHMDQASGRFTETITQVRVVKSFIQEAREFKYFAAKYGTTVGLARDQSSLWHREDGKRKLLLNIVFFLIYSYLVWQVSRGGITPGNFGTVILLINTVTFPIANMSFIIENAQRAIAGSKDYFDVMALQPAITDIPEAKEIIIDKAQLQFMKVRFAYDETPVLKSVSFTVEPASKVALVGESGEGKTTITNLLMRLYEPQQGQILIDGQDISLVTQESLRRAIGVVFQDPALFSGTIRENIAYSRTGATDEQIVKAAKAANAHEFIERLDKGYSSAIGERGVKLSGGQKQRIAIARAILKDAPILVLDEATSSLDSKSEYEVQEALERLMRNRTTIIIAHRLSTIQNVDQIITLRGGRVDETGSPSELAGTDGIYSQLLKLQQGQSESAKKKLKEYEIAG